MTLPEISKGTSAVKPAISGKFCRLPPLGNHGYCCVYMKKIFATKPNTPVVPQHRSLRRFVRKLFASFLKHQASDFQDGLRKEVMQKLRDIEDIITREIARQSKRGKQ